MIDDVTMGRLAFIRYLYQLGVEQSRRPEPLNAVSLLMLHDAADLLLQLGSERLGVGKKGPIFFMDYFDLLAPKVKGGALEGRQSMSRLNAARTNLKHHGNRPSASDIESLRSSTTSFFEGNLPLIFGIAFDEISMARLVKLPEAREYLEKSETLLAAADLNGAVEAVAIAFAYIMKRQDDLEPTPYDPRRMRMPVSMPTSGGVTQTQFDVHDLDEEVRRHSRAIGTLQERVTFLSLGIEPASRERFRRVTPNVMIAFAGNPLISVQTRAAPLTVEDARFCYDFVVGIALALEQRW
jgi:hypothetical protein